MKPSATGDSVPRDVATASYSDDVQPRARAAEAPGADPIQDDDRVPRGVRIASYLLAATLIVVVLRFGLLPAAMSALLVFELVHTLAPRVARRTSTTGGRTLAVFLLTLATGATIVASIAAIVVFVRSDAGSLAGLLSRMAQILENWRATLPVWLVAWLPADVDTLRTSATQWLRQHAAELQSAGGEALRISVEILIGLIIGGMIALADARPHGERQPLEAALLARLGRIADAFRRVVFAQVRIAALNAVLTGLYLLVALPMAGIQLPLQKTLVVVTFLCGLIPVAGNLISNTIIVVFSLGHGFWVGVASLAFLVVIHKLEYFMNARIIGTQIDARAWELLSAMLLMEAVFGIGGVVAAPIVYAYVKRELADRGLV